MEQYNLAGSDSRGQASQPAGSDSAASLFRHGSPLMPRMRVGSRGAGPIVWPAEFRMEQDLLEQQDY